MDEKEQAGMEKAGGEGRGGGRSERMLASQTWHTRIQFIMVGGVGRQNEWAGDGRCGWVTFQGRSVEGEGKRGG